MISLEFIKRRPLLKDDSILNSTLKEAGELVAIFTKSVQTAKKSKQNN